MASLFQQPALDFSTEYLNCHFRSSKGLRTCRGNSKRSWRTSGRPTYAGLWHITKSYKKLAWLQFNRTSTALQCTFWTSLQNNSDLRFDYEYEFNYEYDFLEIFRFDYEYEFDYEYDFLENFRFDYEYEFDYEYNFLENFRFDYEYEFD